LSIAIAYNLLSTVIRPSDVSPGHLCDLDGAIDTVLALATKYRQPITTRLAHQFVNDLRRQGRPDENGRDRLEPVESEED